MKLIIAEQRQENAKVKRIAIHEIRVVVNAKLRTKFRTKLQRTKL